MNSIQFEANIITIQPDMNRLALKLTRDIDKAADLVQDTTLLALRYRNKYRDDVNFRGWISTIMRNYFINGFRRQSRNPINIYDPQGDFLRIAERPIRTYADSLSIVNEIKREVDSLPDTIRIPMLLWIDGYHYNDIADVLNLPLGTVKSRIFHARKKLQHINQ